MTKLERHEECEEFRAQIKFQSNRAEAIKKLVAKESYDEVDKLRIGILLHKVSYALGCDKEYKQLIVRLYQDPELQQKAEDFYKRWNAK